MASVLPGWGILFLVVMAVIALLWVFAVKSIVKVNSKNAVGVVSWVAVITVLPMIGPLLWFVVGLRSLSVSD